MHPIPNFSYRLSHPVHFTMSHIPWFSVKFHLNLTLHPLLFATAQVPDSPSPNCDLLSTCVKDFLRSLESSKGSVLVFPISSLSPPPFFHGATSTPLIESDAYILRVRGLRQKLELLPIPFLRTPDPDRKVSGQYGLEHETSECICSPYHAVPLANVIPPMAWTGDVEFPSFTRETPLETLYSIFEDPPAKIESPLPSWTTSPFKMCRTRLYFRGPERVFHRGEKSSCNAMFSPTRLSRLSPGSPLLDLE